MVKNYIQKLILGELGFDPTSGQFEAIEKLSAYIADDEGFSLFLLQGYAGTGKTTLISALVRVLRGLDMKYVLLGPTGRSAKVLSAYSGESAFTVHKKIYRQKSATDFSAKFALDRNLGHDVIYIVDEASMISDAVNDSSMFGSGDLLEDLMDYVQAGTRCKLILIGDNAQLPPVGKEASPALDVHVLNRYGNVHESLLRDVVRQAEGSGILFNATSLRRILENDTLQKPHFTLEGFTDVERISGGDLIETLSDTYDKVGIENTLVVCRSNKLANRYNQGIRGRILYREEQLVRGDLLMVVRNSYFWTQGFDELDFIANGDIVEIVRIKHYYERYDMHFAEVTVRLTDYGDLEVDCYILLDTLESDSPSLTYDQNRDFFFKVAEDYMHIGDKRKRYKEMRSDPFLNALQIKYANAITCHKAQGGQWKVVFVDQGFFRDDMLSREYLRWLYTAFTRATEKVYLVNFKDEFFE